MSSQSSSRSPGEASYYTAEEDGHSTEQASNVAELAVTASPNGSSDSLYTTANQTPIASPSMSRSIAPAIPITAQYQNSFGAHRRVEESPEEHRERAPSAVTASSRGSLSTPRAEASTYLEKQRTLVTQQANIRKPKINMIEYGRDGISVPMPEKEDDAADSPTAKALDEYSRLWPPQSAPGVNNGRPTGRADTPQGNYIERREASDSPYDYRPTPIDSEPQQQRFLPGSLPSNNTSPLISNRTTNTHQGLATIEESEMPYEYPSGKFIMNPEAPVFVPGQRSRPALRARNPRDWVYQGVPPPKPAQDNQVLSSTVLTNTPNIATPLPLVQLFGSGHGMFFDPNTDMFIGDGPPRKSPYRADGTLPSKPDLQSDSATNEQYPEPREDKLHIQTAREVTKRMANFGKNGPIQRFHLGGPVPQGSQQGTRVIVEKDEEGSLAFGDRMPTAHEMDGEWIAPRRMPTHGMDGEWIAPRRMHPGHETEGEWIAPSRRIYTVEQMEAELARLAGTTGKGEKEATKAKNLGAKEGEGEKEAGDEKKKKEFEGNVVQDFAARKGKARYADSF